MALVVVVERYVGFNAADFATIEGQADVARPAFRQQRRFKE
jgi:hypothetical protein